MTDTNQWLQQAACRGLDPELFYPEQGQSAAQARAVCAVCPVKQECLEDALEHETQARRFGVFGGLTATERARLHQSRTGKSRRKPIAHGTERGYVAHWRLGEEACAACLKAKSQRNLERYHERQEALMAATPEREAS